MAAVLLAILMVPLAMAAPQEADDMRGLLPPDELLRPESVLGALISIEVDRELEADALVQELQDLVRWRARRDAALDELRALYEDMDMLFNTGESEDDAESARLLEDRIRSAESLVQLYGDEGRDLRRRISARRQRLTALTRHADQLVALLPADTDSITGVWDITFTPSDETGVFTLFQNGTLLGGEYVLDGGWHGSLQGTVVGGKVFLERIDAVKGRFADLSGNLDADGRIVRGTWNERVITEGRAVRGSWVGRKRQSAGANP